VRPKDPEFHVIHHENTCPLHWDTDVAGLNFEPIGDVYVHLESSLSSGLYMYTTVHDSVSAR
jgi:hypothetical protein